MVDLIKQKIEHLLAHQGFLKYFKNTSWLLAEKVLRLLLGLFVGIWVARYLGPEQFGLLSYAQSFVGLFLAFSTLGLDGIVVRELVKNEQSKDVILGTAFFLKLGGALIMLLALFVAIQFTSSDRQTNDMVFIIAGAAIFQSLNVIDFFFQSQVLSKYVVFANVITLFLSSLIKIYLIVTNAPLIAFAWMVLFDSVILALGLAYFFTLHRSFIAWRFDFNQAKCLLHDSWPLILSGLMISLYMKIDQVMIKEMLNAEAVGQYAAAVRISEAWYFIPMMTVNSLFPAIINAKTKSEDFYYKRLQQLFSLMVLMAIIIAIPISFVSESLIKLLYGSQYIEAANVLVIHIWSGIFVFLGVASSTWLLNENLQFLSFLRTLIGFLINVLANAILINYMGIVGAAIATICANFTSALLFDVFYYKTRPIFYMKLKALLIHRLYA